MLYVNVYPASQRVVGMPGVLLTIDDHGLETFYREHHPDLAPTRENILQLCSWAAGQVRQATGQHVCENTICP